MQPEELLHLFSPYLPTDRFRALLRNNDLPAERQGAALLVDISGFTPLTTRLVVEFGPERASEELKRRLNPMFEAIAGQVFHHGGSVIRFTGDGFIAWFDDQTTDQEIEPSASVPGVLRAVAAGLEMQAVIPLFRGLRLKVCVGGGQAFRWVVGQPQHGLTDVLLGPAVEDMLSLAAEAQPGQVMVHQNLIGSLRSEGVVVEMGETGNAIVTAIPDPLSKSAHRHRWKPWAAEGDIQETVNSVRHFVDSAIRERVEGGFGDFVAELRYAIPVFIQLNAVSPEAPNAWETLNFQVRMVQGVLASFGGRFVSAEVGDKGSVLFGVFGVPISYGDDAERAIRAAITLRDLRTDSEQHFVLRIGVSRGLLYTGTIGGEVRHEYSTIGDETNIAARLMSAASIGQVLTTSAVRSEVGTRITFHDLPDLTVKGREQPIAVTEPIGVQTGMRQQAHAGALVGRDLEMDQLHKALRAVQKGFPRIVRVEGQAGIGKSRLIAEVVRAATEQHEFQAAGGDCVSTGRNMAYLPWCDVFMSLIGLNPEDDLEANLARLHTFVEDINPDLLPRLPLLADLLKLPIEASPTTAILEGRTRHQALYAVVIDILLNLARRKPLLILLEDTHWIDELSEGLALELARRLTVESAPILLLLVHRPLAEHDHSQYVVDALNEMYIHSLLRLDDLSRPAVNEMIEKYLDASIPPELSHFVYERAHGNPFYIQEVVDTLLETGHIKPIGSIIFVERDLSSADVPHTVHKLVQARIDRLTELDKLVLKVAAVIGQQFPVRVLAKSIPVQMEYAELLQRLRTLEERDFSYQETPEPELTYLFKHAITQEVTYQNLLFAQRRQLHLAVASSLELLAPDAVERLAYHFARTGDDERARHYLLLAGEKAYREYANQAALGYFRQALPLAQDDQARFDINYRGLQIMLRLGDMPGVQAELPALAELASRNGREDWQAAVHIFWANYYTQTSAWNKVVEEAQNAIDAAQQAGDVTLAWEAYLLLRDAYLRLNRADEAEQIIRTMQPLAERLGETRRHIQLALLEVEDGFAENPEISLILANAAIEDARSLADPILEADCWSTLARLSTRENDLPAALEAYNQQIALLRQVGDRRHEGLTLLAIGSALVSLGELSEGNAHLLDAYKILHQIGERSGEAASLVSLGIIAIHHKAYEEALAYLNRGLALQRTLKTQADAARTLFHMANVYILQNNLAAAIGALDEARAVFEANRFSQNVDETYTALSEIDLLRSDLVAARAHIGPLLPCLTEGRVYDLFLPGLAYWRTIKILEQCGENDQAAELRAKFRALMQKTLDKLSESGREALINKIWYHAALLT